MAVLRSDGRFSWSLPMITVIKNELLTSVVTYSAFQEERNIFWTSDSSQCGKTFSLLLQVTVRSQSETQGQFQLEFPLNGKRQLATLVSLLPILLHPFFSTLERENGEKENNSNNSLLCAGLGSTTGNSKLCL